MRQPMASELSSIAIGKYDQTRSTLTVAGRSIPNITAIGRSIDTVAGRGAELNATTARIVKWEPRSTGRTPSARPAGSSPTPTWAMPWRFRGGRSTTSRTAGWTATCSPTSSATSGSATPSHPETWADIWLNEGFATYSELLYQERFNGIPVSVMAKQWYDEEDDWSGKVADPGRDHIFDDLVYTRGALTLEALRLRIGDADFFRILRGWPTVHRYGNASTADFIAFAERVSGRNLDGFFHTWLYSSGKPDLPLPAATAAAADVARAAGLRPLAPHAARSAVPTP